MLYHLKNPGLKKLTFLAPSVYLLQFFKGSKVHCVRVQREAYHAQLGKDAIKTKVATHHQKTVITVIAWMF